MEICFVMSEDGGGANAAVTERRAIVVATTVAIGRVLRCVFIIIVLIAILIACYFLWCDGREDRSNRVCSSVVACGGSLFFCVPQLTKQKNQLS